MTNNIIYRLTSRVGNSTLSMDKILSVTDFTSKEMALAAIPENMSVRDRFVNPVNVNKPYIALTAVENGCVHSCINFYQ